MKKSKSQSNEGTSLGTFDGVDLRLTAQNTLFVIYKKTVAYPHLRGPLVRFDVGEFIVPKSAFDKIREVLLKQAEIRRQNRLDYDEDEAIYQYSWERIQHEDLVRRRGR
jgi:hypothetical protein